MLSVLDLFSGIGGISLGLEATGGFRTVAFCEIEPFPREVLRKHWPGVPIFEDVRTLSAESLGGLQPDLICGGFPCQDVSVAGKGAGLSGARSGLWSEFARLVGELGPRWVLAENVGALRTRGVDRVCSDLEGEGYAVWPLLVGAWAVGAPHRRERVWIVAHRDGRGLTGERVGGPLDGERAAPGDDADGRGERPVGEPTGEGLEGQRADAGEPQEPEPRHTGELDHADREGRREARRGRGQDDCARAGDDQRPAAQESDPLADCEGERRAQQGHGRDAGSRLGCDGTRWPARPGEPQHEWECSRLANPGRSAGDGRASQPGRQPEARVTPSRTGGPGNAQLPLGSAAHGLPERLARRANREALKALGNAVVPQVVRAIGLAILEAEAELT